jgi:asparagine synthase (glutamine-hydrolysing)
MLSPDHVLDGFDRWIDVFDEPFADQAALPTMLLAGFARREVTVVLTGEGADEVFGGYGRYALAARRAGLLGRLRRLRRPDAVLTANAFSPPALAAALAGGEGGDPLAGRRELLPPSPGGGDLFRYDQRTYLQALLQRQDRMSMAVGVEAREPFLDHHLVAWANALPAAVKLPGGETKGLLKDVAAPWLPQDIIRREKNGFAVPTGRWMRPGEPFHDRVRALTDPGSPVAGWTDRRAVGRLIDEHMAGAADHRVPLWTLIALDAWARVHLTGPSPEGW